VASNLGVFFMITDNAKYVQFMMQPWVVQNTLNGSKTTCHVEVGAALDFYMDMGDVHRMVSKHSLNDIKYLSGGSEMGIDLLFKKCGYVATPRKDLLRKYRETKVDFAKGVGPMFLHYVAACAKGDHGTYRQFCETRTIGDIYLEPSIGRPKSAMYSLHD
jgi:hypothetical protein